MQATPHLAALISEGVYDEAACKALVDRVHSTTLDRGLTIIERLLGHVLPSSGHGSKRRSSSRQPAVAPAPLGEVEAEVLARYLLPVSTALQLASCGPQACSHDERCICAVLRPWHATAVASLGTRSHVHRSTLERLCPLLMAHDQTFAARVFARYMELTGGQAGGRGSGGGGATGGGAAGSVDRVGSASSVGGARTTEGSLALRLICKFSALRPVRCFDELARHVLSRATRPQALGLTLTMVQRNDRNLARITSSTLWSVLLRVLLSDSNFISLALALWTAVMLLPHVAARVCMPTPIELFGVFRRCLLAEPNDPAPRQGHGQGPTTPGWVEPAAQPRVAAAADSRQSQPFRPWSQRRPTVPGGGVGGAASSVPSSSGSAETAVGATDDAVSRPSTHDAVGVPGFARPAPELRHALATLFSLLYVLVPVELITFLHEHCSRDQCFRVLVSSTVAVLVCSLTVYTCIFVCVRVHA